MGVIVQVKRSVRKVLVYLVILSVLVAVSLVVNEVRQTREVINNPAAGRPPTQRAAPAGNGGFSEPPAGKDKPWSVSELAWALSERITLDVLESFATTQIEVDAYNERVAEYNRRASHISYREPDMAEAVRQAESRKEEIVRGALEAASAAPKLPHGDEVFERIWRVQSYLKAMGFYLAAVDGEMNDETQYAIMNYQVSVEVEPTGTVDDILLQQLEESLTIQYTPEQVGFDAAPMD